ncbi:cytochrome aa3 quinol oxidase subunit I [Paenibacillus thiaminolyticus]|uniref:Cytochrome c oxidase subunit 1 n=1 Tax=Paenibacillus thiaminolyticus TaxID=49283 RepID=A0AAP9J3D4_PANTH|nr:cytochrome aa3 quinol oxidase subunit I [Paenibacillus thiaminolyticus]MCY9534576.1 cytochrome aa3 quinol oxidase subunit I [Paenibacillus thiaminolyticus]MCY9600178.1 cytochrome aa3 quinol oxidase subunit I [Paenibacillus thiaminolyticus]MCY9608544.1 cytochrome aa3 quinol oxidase subunit I [Paenibacillus thiaminolyticus]MCY9615164.1 cytochrome aa3 quinol oxidase subunit I [Paenibacillus thiaminolyticus]MCY9620628.1 cytochrome aa3 quinol oxidase subunit I [Paenibacillus thiaminolyticus]
MKWDEFFVTGEPMIYGAMASIVIASLAILIGLTYFKKWGYLWREWLTTVDHKRIGVMYIIAALLMLFRGGVDALLMRTQLAAPDMKFLDAQHYNEIFTTHGVIMILFMAMPFIIGLMNVVIPLQIGARDVAFPRLNAVSFWLFFSGAMLFNISFVIGGSPDAGWTAYFPLASLEFSPTVGNNFYSIALQIAGIGTLMTGVNFIVTILKMRAPGMTLMRMPMFTWSVLITCVIILFAFPVLTVALALMMFDRMFGAQFFTMANGGMDMLWANLFWVWGHPEVYIVVLPAFGIYSEIISTFSRKNLYGYKSMVFSMVAISLLSFVVWAHHFYTMGHGAMVNGFFSVTTMAIAVPTGVKIFNWLFTMQKGKIQFTTPMMYALAFIPIFTIGGVTGVMLAMASADYQYHNTMFLVAHFHYVLIPGTVFAVIAGMYYWFPKIFGFRLNERLGKISFWFIAICFNITFLPLFFLGLNGMTRRMYTYSAETGFGPLNLIATIGSFGLAIGFAILVYNIYWSARYAPRDKTGDPWDARTLEWSTHSPVPEYNFAVIPNVKSMDAFWFWKKDKQPLYEEKIEEIHMPNNSGQPFVLGVIFFFLGFFLIFSWWIPSIIAGLGVLIMLAVRSFERDHGHHIPVKTIQETEQRLRGEQA